MFEVGQTVRVLEPFTEAFPDQYVIEYINGSVAGIADGRDFDFAFLEAI